MLFGEVKTGLDVTSFIKSKRAGNNTGPLYLLTH